MRGTGPLLACFNVSNPVDVTCLIVSNSVTRGLVVFPQTNKRLCHREILLFCLLLFCLVVQINMEQCPCSTRLEPRNFSRVIVGHLGTILAIRPLAAALRRVLHSIKALPSVCGPLPVPPALGKVPESSSEYIVTRMI